MKRHGIDWYRSEEKTLFPYYLSFFKPKKSDILAYDEYSYVLKTLAGGSFLDKYFGIESKEIYEKRNMYL